MNADEPISSQQSTYMDGERFDFVLTTAQVHATPRWEEDAPNPPLSARTAARIAEAFLPRLVREATRWRFRSVHLYPWDTHGWWVYNITFLGFHPPGVKDGAVPSIDIPVLMDGTIVEPTRSPHPLHE